MAKIRIQGVVATTHPMGVYGGVSFPETVIQTLADGINDGSIPLALQHDPRSRLDAQVIEAVVDRSDDGHLQVVATYEVDEAEWEAKGGEGLTGFSPSMRQPFLGDREGTPAATIAADAHWFSDEQLTAAYDDLSKSGLPVQALRLYQFAVVPPALVVFVLQQLGAIPFGMRGAYLYDSLKHLVSHDEPSKFDLNITDERTGKTTHAYVETSSDDVLKHAIDTLPGLLDHGGGYDYSSEDEAWKSRNGTPSGDV